MENKYENTANVFKALCDPNRIVIIDILQSGEKCACKLLEDLKIGQPTLSHHIKILCEAGFVDSRRDGKWTYYSLNTNGFKIAKELLDNLERKNGGNKNGYNGETC